MESTLRRTNFLYSIITLLLLTIKCSDNATETLSNNIVEDIDGNNYKVVKIGTQWWMAENLKVTHFRNGEPIINVKSNSEWASTAKSAYCYYQNDTTYIDQYGLLYNWYAINSSFNIAPEGWHVASDDDWKELEMYLGLEATDTNYTGFRGSDHGIKLKEGDFNAIYGGMRGTDGNFSNITSDAYWWTATEFCRLNAWYYGLTSASNMVKRNFDSKHYSFSVRCVKD